MKTSTIYQSAIDNTLTPEQKVVGVTLVQNLTNTKVIYTKFMNKQTLTDEEVVYGVKAFFELSTDLSECVGQMNAAIDALDLSNALRFIAKERNLCLTA